MELHCNFSVTPEPGAKPVMIAVESDEEKNLWREKLERFAWTVKKQEASTREGYFYKRGKSNKDGYKKRCVHLFCTFICYRLSVFCCLCSV